MTEAFDLRLMSAVLKQGRSVFQVSLAAAVIAAVWLIAGMPGPVSRAILLASLALSALQVYFSVRVSLDREIFAAAAEQGGDLEVLDQAMANIRLAKRGTFPLRDWPSRWQGAKRLFLRQTLVAGMQLLLLLIAAVKESHFA